MQVIKRDGTKETVNFSKITARIKKLVYELDKSIDANKVAQKVIEGVKDGITTTEIDNLAAEQCAMMATIHPDYSILASRIAITNLHKNTYKHFSTVMKHLYEYKDSNGHSASLLSDETYRIIERNSHQLDSAIIYDRDFNLDYFGFKTLEKSYLLKINGKVAERPQHMFMRVAVGIHGKDIEAALETYNLLSEGWFTHATPTLFNAGTRHQQLSSCFLIGMKNDSISGIYDTLKTCAEISKYAGGIGLHVHNIRANGSYIRGTNGTSNGLVPMLKVFNETARYVDQGGNRRKGSIAIYLEPWHSDIIEFLDLKKPNGKEELRARDLFLALWIPDLFMQRVEKDEYWHLMCPDECPGLSDCYGEEFNKLYLDYVAKGKYRKVVKARDIWDRIISSQLETGTPYLLYKDSVNLKSNQKNLGTIKSSNLCTEIVEYTSPEEVAVCNLASIALPKFVTDGKFDHQRLFEVTQVITKNLNKVIDINFYPVKEAEYSNKKHRPIGIGVQGLADVFFKLHIPFDSDEARKLNKEIFETIYFGALTASKDLAKKDGVYDSYKGSPASQGILQYDMWGVIPSIRWDWNKLKESIKKHGLRNSLLLAPMPTASTSQILGNTECFEPITSNLYTRRVLSGEFIVVNKYLLKDLIELKLWNDSMRQALIANDGSVQNLNIPDNLKAVYRTVWEISQRSLIDMAADRGAFICQSQSLNLFVDNPNYAKLTSMHFYAWQRGLKTGVYYTRIKSARNPIKFTVSNNSNNEVLSCKINDPDCMTCSS